MKLGSRPSPSPPWRGAGARHAVTPVGVVSTPPKGQQPSRFRQKHARPSTTRARFIGPGAPPHRQSLDLESDDKNQAAAAVDRGAWPPSPPLADAADANTAARPPPARRSSPSLSVVLADPRTQLVASLIFIGLYVMSTYSPPPPFGPRATLDFSLSLLFAADAARRIAASPLPPLQAALQPSNLLDLLSSAPALLEPAIAALAAALSSGTSAAPALAAASAAGGLRWLRVFRALRLLRLAMLSANLPRMRTSRGALLLGAYNVPLLSLIASVGALAATGAALVSAVERMPLHDALYFVLSSLSTIGFGDIVARTLPGRAVVLALMVCALVLVPARVQQLAQQMARRPVAAGPLPSSGGRRPFVVLSASRLSDVRGFEDLLAGVGAMARREAAREARRRQRRRRREASGEGGDNNDDDDADATPQPLAPLLGERDPHVVALASTPPGPEFLALQEIAESRGRRLTLLQGSVFSADDLTRAALERAEAVVVAADRFASSSSRGGSGAGSASAASAAAAAMFGGGPHHKSPGIDRPGTPSSSSSSSSSNGAAAPSMLFAAPPLPSGAITGNEDADEAEEDVEALFRVWALKAYTETTPLRVQVLREGAARRVAPFLDPRRDVVVSVEHTRLRLLALAALCPGASTLVANLLRPATRDEWGDAAAGAGGAVAALGDDDDDERTDDDEEEDNQEREQNEQQKQRRRASFAGRAWLREYADGCRADVLPLKAGPHLRGATFAAAAEAVATATRGRVVPLGTVDVRRQRVRLNPSPRLLRAGDELLCACRGGDRLAEAAVEGPRGAASTTTAAVKRALGLGRERAAAVAASLVAAAAAGTQEDASPSRQPPPTPTTRAEQAAALEELVRRGHPCLTGWAAPGSSSMAGASLDWGGGNGGLGLGATAGVRPSSALGIGGAAAVASSDSSAGEEEEDEEEEGAAAAAGGDGDQDDETCSVESLQELAEEVRAIVEKQQLQRQRRQLEAAAAAAAAASAAAGAPSHPAAAANPAASATPRRPPTKPSSRHFILCGHADSFLPFARQLVRSLPRPAGGGAASSPAPQRLSLVVVHPDATPEGAAALERALRVTIATDAAASAAEVARRARRRADVGGGGSGRGQREEQAAAAAAVAAAAAAAIVAAASSSPLSDDNNNSNQHLLPPPVVHVSVRAVAGKPMDKAALEAAGARRRGAALVFVGPRDRRQPSGGSSSDPGPSSSSEAAYGSLSRAAVQADADALLTAYGVGEPRSGGGGGAAGRRRWEGLLLSWLPGAVAAAAAASAASASGSSAAVRPLSPPPPSELPLPESLHAVVELSFTSSVRLLQPGLLLHGGPAAGGGGGGEGVAATTTRPSTPSSAGKQPRASWRDRRAAESDARGEGLAEWQVSAYYAAGRALVPAAVDTLVSVQPLYRGFRLPALLEALCGDAPGGAAASTAAPSVAGGGGGGVGGGSPLAQRRVPRAFVGRTWGELAQAMLVLGDAAFAGGGGGDDDEEQEQWQQSGGDGGAACLVPLGLLRPKVESPSWRLPFVSALPEAETRLDARDVAFFLRPGG